ncbi:hypothetical protein [Pelodictyon phaeoclathratiforme]|jgi:hypothetical protein|uniref:SMODS and SLOG-associating 2TM effector domain-containing protein n=1 Tax=Pelodictyon phaeoclathratiforme (strain DSM 5477 / BU-1) TaxID=324925 RepID=B4SA21_PELPB|nr:hypothetical protein [Pelodictyon phaeoclathratiforme]ACF43717.1 hypothetical protein Ppha_1464 [Pelodictyon phaeoclathratiforme BU-1]MBV5289534.1 hypothetical protein [Pelodictyon phaeoclathratiforme]
MPNKPEQVFYDLRIGVTGHRNLSQKKAVTEAVKRIVTYLDQLICDHDNIFTEWSVISPLAKGADTIVARSFLEKPDTRLEVFLPFPLEIHRKKLTDPTELAEFNQLFERASVYYEPPQDSKGYLTVGKEIVNTCEILIVIWDGKETKGKGGTADIVKYALESGRTIIRIDAENPNNPPKLLLTRKNKEEENCIPEYYEFPLPKTAAKLLVNYYQFVEFCRDKSLTTTEHALLTAQCRHEVKTLAKAVDLPEKQIEPVLEYLIPTYVRADELAKRYQKLFVLASKAIPIYSAIAVSVLVFQVIFFPDEFWIIWLEICSMLGAKAMPNISKKLRWYEKWIDYRILAEQLRTTIYTSIVLNKNSLTVSTPAPKTFPRYNTQHNWIDLLIENQLKMTINRLGIPENFSATKKFVITGLLDDQKKWHIKHSFRMINTEHLLRNYLRILFFITLTLAVLHLSNIEFLKHLYFEKWGIFLAITLPFWETAIHSIGKQQKYEIVAKRSNKMANELNQIVELAEKSTSMAELRKIITHAMQAVKLETFEWRAFVNFDSCE